MSRLVGKPTMFFFFFFFYCHQASPRDEGAVKRQKDDNDE